MTLIVGGMDPAVIPLPLPSFVQEARNEFKNPEVTDPKTLPAFKWTAPGVGGGMCVLLQ